MVSSEEQKKNFIDRLQLTTAKGDEYIILPNAENPAFLIPTESKEIYVKALALIKPLSGKGELKKRMLSYLPPKWLKKKMSTLEFDNNNEQERYTIILPWSQKICDKLTYISFTEDMSDITVHKYAFSKETREMVRNEHAFLQKIDTSKSNGIQVPDIKGFEEGEDYTCLMQDFVDGMHMKNISPSITSFFSSLNGKEILPLKKHPYILNRMPLIEEVLLNSGEDKLQQELAILYEKYMEDKFQVATMHSDFSSSNTVQTPDNQCIIIDWEDACEDGICIDAEYFNFRKTLLNKEKWAIKNAEQFLAVFHYTYFMAKKKNTEMLKKFKLRNQEFSMA